MSVATRGRPAVQRGSTATVRGNIKPRAIEVHAPDVDGTGPQFLEGFLHLQRQGATGCLTAFWNTAIKSSVVPIFFSSDRATLIFSSRIRNETSSTRSRLETP